MTDQDTAELHRMVAEDPLPTAGPDVDALVAGGRRRLRIRRAGTGAAALAAAAAIGVPTALLVGGPGSATDPAEDHPAAAVPTATGPCGQLFCGTPGAGPGLEEAPLAGEPWVVGELADGTEEVIYAATPEGFDQGTGDRSTVEVLMVGYRTSGELHRAAWTVQPGSDGASPDGDPVQFWANQSLLGAGSGDQYLVVGFVEGTPEQITWSTPDGESGAVDGMSTTVLDGFTAFHLSQPYPEGSEPRDPQRVDVTRGENGELIEQGGEVVLEGDGTAGGFPPDLTIHTSDGWSCSLAECGSMG